MRLGADDYGAEYTIMEIPGLLDWINYA